MSVLSTFCAKNNGLNRFLADWGPKQGNFLVFSNLKDIVFAIILWIIVGKSYRASYCLTAYPSALPVEALVG